MAETKRVYTPSVDVDGNYDDPITGTTKPEVIEAIFAKRVAKRQKALEGVQDGQPVVVAPPSRGDAPATDLAAAEPTAEPVVKHTRAKHVT